MTITITSNVQRYETNVSPCLCTQNCDEFYDIIRGDTDITLVQGELEKQANKKCTNCHGLGVESFDVPVLPELNLANANARILFSILGLDLDKDEYSISDMKRGIIRGLNIDLSKFIREDEVIYGEPCYNNDGIVDLRPGKVFIRGLDKERIESYIYRLNDMIQAHEKSGATKFLWY